MKLNTLWRMSSQKAAAHTYCMFFIVLATTSAFADEKVKISAPRPTTKATQIPPSTNSKDSPGKANSSVSNPLDPSNMQQDFGKLPTNITSDTLVLHSQDRVFIYKGNVVVKQGDMTLLSKQLEGTYNEQNQIEKMVAKGEVVITKQEIKATCQRAMYDAVTSIVTLTENPQLEQKDSVLTADKIKVYLTDNRSEAEGNVRVTLIKPADGNIGVTLGTPTAKPSPNTTPKFSTLNEPPKRDLPTPAPSRTPAAVAVMDLNETEN